MTRKKTRMKVLKKAMKIVQMMKRKKLISPMWTWKILMDKKSKRFRKKLVKLIWKQEDQNVKDDLINNHNAYFSV